MEDEMEFEMLKAICEYVDTTKEELLEKNKLSADAKNEIKEKIKQDPYYIPNLKEIKKAAEERLKKYNQKKIIEQQQEL